MKNIPTRLFPLLAVLCWALAWSPAPRAADDSQSDFHGLVVSLYSFQPHTLNSAQMAEKSDKLDAFRAGVKGDPAKNLPLLRRELGDPANSRYFFYDGAKLLLSLSQASADRQLALRSIPKVDLRDIDGTDYLRTVHGLATQGYDIRAAAFRILAYPEFKAFIPQHPLTLGQNYALIYMLLPMPEQTYLFGLAARLPAEMQPESQKSILRALWYTATPLGRRTIRQFADNQAMPATTRAYAKELLTSSTSLIEFDRLTANLGPGKAD